jgi:putative membrane protein
MTNKQLIKSAHIVALVILLACGLLVVTGKARITTRNQNSNQNGNTNTGSGNTNTNRSQNQNTTRSSNRNSRDMSATGTQTGMGNMDAQDRKFLMDAAMGGMMEVQLGHMAAQLGSSDAVKQFGQRMVDDHGKANADLMTLAQSKGVTLPTALDEKHQQEMRKLQAMSGADFDRAYMKMMVSDHKKDVSEFEKQSTRGMDSELKAFATTTLPTLKEHLQQAESIAGTEGSGGAANSNTNRTMNSNSNSNRSMNSNSNRSNRNSNRNSNGNSNGNSNSNRP